MLKIGGKMKIRLTDSLFSKSQEIGEAVLFKLSADRLLAPFYEGAGKEAKASRYGGWEAMGISGHSLGHYLTALALCYESTGNEKARETAAYVVDELAFLQKENGYVCGFSEEKGFSGVFDNPEGFTSDGFDLAGWWVPYYTLHKIFRGLIDVYEKTGSKKALDVVTKLGMWVYETTSTLSEEQRLRVLKCEYGGMNQVLSRLYRISGDERFRKASMFFTQEDLLIPLSEGEDILTGKHANTQIPKICGAVEVYRNGGEEYLYKAAEFFFDTVARNRSYAIGGNSQSEHFPDIGKEPLEVNTCETCNSNNMLVLTKALHEMDKRADYYDYAEKVLYNHILPSQDETGMKTYFVSLKSGHFKVYSTLEDSFWCCFGSGLENPFTYNSHIYSRDEKGLYVNLYIPSVLEDKDLSVKLLTSFPETEKVSLVFEEDTDEALYLRKPSWCDGFNVVYKDKAYTTTEKGYIVIEGGFRKGDRIDIKLPMKIQRHNKRDNENQVYFTYGPVVLAERLGRENFPESDRVPDQNQLNNHECIEVEPITSVEIKKEDGLKFSLDGRKIEPFYNILHERYRVYFEVKK